MDDREFFDTLMQLWSKTTGAADTYWMPEEDTDFDEWNLYSVNEKNDRRPLGDLLNEADADWITAVHGCFPDLVRRLHDALDEADRVDLSRDEAEQMLAAEMLRNAELEIEVLELKAKAEHLESLLAPPF